MAESRLSLITKNINLVDLQMKLLNSISCIMYKSMKNPQSDEFAGRYMLKRTYQQNVLRLHNEASFLKDCFPPRRISLNCKRSTLCLNAPVDVKVSALSSSRILDASGAGVSAQNVAHILVLDDVGSVSKTLHVDSVNSHGEDHLTLVDNTLNTHDVSHTDGHSTSLDTGSLAVDIGFEVSKGEDMLLANDGVALFGLLDVVAETLADGHAGEKGAWEDGEAVAEFVAVAACGFVFDCQGSGLVRVLQDKLGIVLHAKVDDQVLEEGCAVAERVQPIHDLVLDLELGLRGLVVFGNWRFFSEDAERVDGGVDGKDTLAKVSVDTGESRSRGGFEHDDFIVGSGNSVLDDHVQNLTRQIEQRKHSSSDMILGEIFSRVAGHCGRRFGRILSLTLNTALDVFDDLFANLGALLCLKACLAHG
jgi:hypothetical protein